jgi:trans-aconitate methyltransferase
VRLLDRVPQGQVRGFDADASMITTARERHNGDGRLRFAVLPAQELHQAGKPASAAAIVSTACLHWVPAADHPAVLSGARRLLESGGQWCVEFGGAGQLASMRAILDPLVAEAGDRAPAWFFPSAQEYGDLLRGAGFLDIHVELLHQRRAMPDAESLRGLLTSQVLVAYLPSIEASARDRFVEQACDSVVAAVESAHAGDGHVDYDVQYVRVVARAVNP